ncbi:MAG TPA: hypothetical protein VEI02_05745 [Planctomycetota bacterium]|nr:hypothetical protein [Planctomycetota bacterium]
MLRPLLVFLASAAVVTTAGAALSRAADRIAEITGFGRLLVGAVLLAAATSLPELAVDWNAARAGEHDLAVGDLTGSSLMNLAILAVADLMHRSGRGMFSRAAAGHALTGTTSMLLAALAAVMILARVGGAFGPVGFGTLGVFGAYVLCARMVYHDQRAARAAEVEAETPSARAPRARLTRPALTFAAGATAILVAAPYVAESAATLAELTGLGGTFVGVTLVAACTSLPEPASTVSAVRAGAFDLAVGNIFGSNVFNIAMLVAVDAAAAGPLTQQVSTTHAVTLLWTTVISATAVIGQLYHVERRRRLVEPDAWMVLTLVAAALYTVYRLR